MKKTMALVSTAIVMNLLTVGCGIDNSTNCPADLTGELSAMESEFMGTWVLTDMVSETEVDLTDDGVENPSTEIFQQLEECKKDVFYEFENTRIFRIKQGFTASNCDNKQTLEGTWQIANDKLVLVALCSTQANDIEISEDKTVFTLQDAMSFQDVYGFAVHTNVTFTYEKS